MADTVVLEGTEQVAEAMLPKLLHPRTPQDRPQVAVAVRRDDTAGPTRADSAAAQRGMALRLDAADLLPTINVRTLRLRRRDKTRSAPRRNAANRRGHPRRQVRGDPRRGPHVADGKSSTRQRRAGGVPGKRTAVAVGCRLVGRPPYSIRRAILSRARSTEFHGHMSAATPASLGYFMPAEWAPRVATWLSWPHNLESWPGAIRDNPGRLGRTGAHAGRVRAGPYPGRKGAQ